MDSAIGDARKRADKNCVPAVWKEITTQDYVVNLLTFGGLSLWRQQEYWRQKREYQTCVDNEFKELIAKYGKI